MVWDTQTEKLIGDIPNTPGVHGAAIALDLNRGFTSNGRDSSVTIFDLATLATIGVVHGTGRNPDAITYDPVSKRVFTFNGRSATATAIDAATGTIVGTVPLGGKPRDRPARRRRAHHRQHRGQEQRREIRHALARGDGGVASRSVRRADGNGSGSHPSPSHHRLRKQADGDNGQQYGARRRHRSRGRRNRRLRLRREHRTRLHVERRGHGDGRSSDSPDAYTVVATVPTKARARTMALDPSTGRVYTVTADFDPLQRERRR